MQYLKYKQFRSLFWSRYGLTMQGCSLIRPDRKTSLMDGFDHPNRSGLGMFSGISKMVGRVSDAPNNLPDDPTGPTGYVQKQKTPNFSSNSRDHSHPHSSVAFLLHFPSPKSPKSSIKNPNTTYSTSSSMTSSTMFVILYNPTQTNQHSVRLEADMCFGRARVAI